MKKDTDIQNSRIKIHHFEDELSYFQKKEEEHDKKISPLVVLLLAWIVLYFCSILFTITYHQWDFSLAWILKQFSSNINHFYAFIMGSANPDGMDHRVYQYLIVAISGMALATCGCIFQGTFKNVLAGPSSMGVMAGGTLGCTVYVMYFAVSTENVLSTFDEVAYQKLPLWSQYQQQLFTLAGCAAGVCLVIGIAMAVGKGKLSASAMLMSGIILSTVIENITILVQYSMIMNNPQDERIEAIRNLIMGNFNHADSIPVLLMMGIPIGLCVVILICISGRLNLLSFGEEEARTMGIRVGIYRNLIIGISTIMTAVVIAFCGQIGFLGFMVPLMARKIVGADMRKLIPASMLMGAIFLTLIFDVAYFLGMTDSLNVITSAIGCVFMIVVLLRRGERKNAT